MPIDIKILSSKVEDEVKIMAMVRNHPNVIQLDYGFKIGQSVFMCMELFMGHDLLHEIQSHGNGNGLGEERARFLFRQLLEGIHYCRNQNIIHGDIKLENILVNKRGQLKLIDFGFSHIYIEGRNLEVFQFFIKFIFLIPITDSWRNSHLFSS